VCEDHDVFPHAVTEPFDSGMLDVGDGHRLYWEAAGNPNGKPAVLLHGGPGSGLSPNTRKHFDPDRYLIVQFDQRQCGRSTPHAAEPVVDLSTNTTAHLIADIELLRRYIGVERWMVWGGSWGTILGLAYAEAHPDRVTEMILASVVTSSRAGVDWVTRSMGRVFPEAWERFRNGVPMIDRNGNLPAAYARLVQHPDPEIHAPAAAAWCAWEDVHVATTADHEPNPRYLDARFRLGFSRLVTHYWSNAHFLDDDALFRDAHRLVDIPMQMVNGRMDISGPPDIPWRLAALLPKADLIILRDEGHGGGSSMSAVIAEAAERFAGAASA